MIIDAHNHPDWLGHNLSRFLANMDRHRIDKCWILTWECPAHEYDPTHYLPTVSPLSAEGPIPLSRALTYAERGTDRFVLGYAPDPRLPGGIDRLKAAVALYGVRVYGELKLRMMFDNPDALRMYRWCGEQNLPIVVHVDYEYEAASRFPRPGYWYGGGIEALERAVRAVPEAVFIGHGPGFWGHISGDEKILKQPYPTGGVKPGGRIIDMMRRFPNLHADLSAGSGRNALDRDRSFTLDFMAEFQDRILFGRDSFDNKLMELLQEAGLSETILEKITSGNALRLVPEE